ncbi:MAG TPA: hypothetical protein VHO46_09870 [Bacteroidales bacterium]|nr:hypothetical protein [Bacteroidales bacterium]
MPELSPDNIEQITLDISRQEISFSHLLDELIDHVCCDVENEMLSGLTFSEAYSVVKKKFGPDTFRNIQRDSLYAVDLKYRNMKNTMKISGIAGTVLFGTAAMFKVQHWPAAGILMTIGAIILALVFLPSALGVLWKETHNKRRVFLFVSAFISGVCFITGTLFKVQHWPASAIILSISFFTSLFLFLPAAFLMITGDTELKKSRSAVIFGIFGALLYMTGMLFRIQHWPLTNVLIVSGIVTICIVAIPWYSVIRWKTEQAVQPSFLFIIIACMAIVVPGVIVNFNLQESFDNGYYINQEKESSFYKFLDNNNISLRHKISDSVASGKAGEIHRKTIELVTSIDDIQMALMGKEQHIARHLNLEGTDSRNVSENTIAERVKQYDQDLRQLAPLADESILNMLTCHQLFSDQNASVLLQIQSLNLLKTSILAAESVALKSLLSEN